MATSERRPQMAFRACRRCGAVLARLAARGRWQKLLRSLGWHPYECPRCPHIEFHR